MLKSSYVSCLLMFHLAACVANQETWPLNTENSESRSLKIAEATVVDGVANISAVLTNNSNADFCYWKQASGASMGVDIEAPDGRPFLSSTTETVIMAGSDESRIGSPILQRLEQGKSISLVLQMNEPVDGAFQDSDGRTYQEYSRGDALIFIVSVFISDCMSGTMEADDSLDLLLANRKVTLRY